MKFKKGKFNAILVRAANGSHTKEFEGYTFKTRIQTGENHEFIVHRDIEDEQIPLNKRLWVVSEVSTGARVTREGYKTRKQAVESSLNLIENSITNTLLQSVLEKKKGDIRVKCWRES